MRHETVETGKLITFEGGEGAGIGLALCVGLGLVAAPLLLALAAWVAAKI